MSEDVGFTHKDQSIIDNWTILLTKKGSIMLWLIINLFQSIGEWISGGTKDKAISWQSAAGNSATKEPEQVRSSGGWH